MALVVQCSDASSSPFSPPSSILFFSRLPLLPSSFMAYRKPSQLASTYPAQFTISTLQQTPFLLYTNKLVQIKLPAPPANTAEGGKASLQPECTVPVSEREIEAVQARKTFLPSWGFRTLNILTKSRKYIWHWRTVQEISLIQPNNRQEFTTVNPSSVQDNSSRKLFPRGFFGSF